MRALGPSGMLGLDVDPLAVQQVQAADDDDRGADPGHAVGQHAPQAEVEQHAPQQGGVFQRRDRRGLALAERLDTITVVEPDALRYGTSFILRGLERVELDITYM